MTDLEIERIKYLSVEVLKKDPTRTPELTRELNLLLDKQEVEEAGKPSPSECES